MVKVVIDNKKGLVQSSGNGITKVQDGIACTNSAASVDGAFKIIHGTVVVANGDTSGKTATKIIPAGFVALNVHVQVTGASTNGVTIDQIGTDADPNAFCLTGMGATANAVGDKGNFAPGGIAGIVGLASNFAGITAADELKVTVSGDPGLAGSESKITIVGFQLSA